jgi:hypothetical protein
MAGASPRHRVVGGPNVDPWGFPGLSDLDTLGVVNRSLPFALEA